MLKSRGKISLRQAMFIFLIMVYSPAIRFLPMYSSLKAKQAGWLTPFVAIIPLVIELLILKGIFSKYRDESMMEVFYDIFGKWVGKVIVFVYLLWTILLSALYMRYAVERIVSSTYPKMDISIFALANIVLIAYILRKGITVIGRMSELILPVIILTFIAMTIFLLPDVRIDNVTPVSTRDIIPVLKGSVADIAIGQFMFLIFFMGEHINNKEKILKSGIISSVFYVVITGFVIFTTIGTLSSTVTSRLPIPYIVAVKQISVLDTIENIESTIVGAWIFSDFILTSVLVFISLNILKSLFNLKETKYLLNILLVLIYFMTLGFAVSRFEIIAFSKAILVWLNSVMGFIVPLILFTVGKVRKKL